VPWPKGEADARARKITLTPPSVFLQAGALLTMFYVLVVYGRLADTFLQIPLIAFLSGGAAIGITLIAGGIGRAASTRSGKAFLFLTVWLIFCIPLSMWPGGSFSLIKDFWLKSIALFFLIASNITSLKLYRGLTNTVAVAVVLILVALRFFGISQEGRLELETGALNNPNDLASHLLVGLPFLLLILDLKGIKSVLGLGSLALTGLVVMTVLNTGSRAGLLTLIAIFGYRFLRASMGSKILLAGMAVGGIFIAPLFVSVESMERYLSMFGEMSQDQATSRQVEYAEGSAEGRMRLLKDSVITTFKYPVFGVGPGAYSVHRAEQTSALGVKAMWAQTHNSFTQMSSEGGLIAGYLYILLTLRALFNGRRVAKEAAARGPRFKELRASGEALALSVVSFIVVSFFGNYAYMIYVPLLAGCGESLAYITSRELALLPKPVAAARPLAPVQAAPPAFRPVVS
jgi:O-antigen ligase